MEPLQAKLLMMLGSVTVKTAMSTSTLRGHGANLRSYVTVLVNRTLTIEHIVTNNILELNDEHRR
jgi:hypothetical protein